MQLLAGDVGGTKTKLALFSSKKEDSLSLMREASFHSSNYEKLESLVSEFMSKSEGTVELACLGVAGPIEEGHAELTNLKWEIDELELSKRLGIPKVKLLNDLQATAYQIPFLEHHETETINEGVPAGSNGVIAVISPGTGLGEAFLIRTGRNFTPYASEGGHCDYGPKGAEERGLLEFLSKKSAHVSFERVCSGPGIYNIYQYFLEKEPNGCPDAEEITKAQDPAPLITESALTLKEGSLRYCSVCRKTIDTFASILGSEAGNLALKVMARGGLYVGGGIAPKTMKILKEGKFMQSFLNKGRMSKMLSKIPVKVIRTERAPLLGAARYGLDLNSEESEDILRTRMINEQAMRS